MKIYNSLTRKVEDFIPHKDREVTMYTCGPTVYYYAHIGNLRTYISEDILEKGLNYIGYKVPLQDEEIIKSLILDEDVKNMPCWPDAGSIRVIDDTVVIKCEELTE